LVSALQVGDTTFPLTGFSHRPFDTRTACVVAGPPSVEVNSFLAQSRAVGAPLVFLGTERRWNVWSQSASGPSPVWLAQRGPIDEFFKTHKAALDPRAIFRAKTQGRLDVGQQLSFVDAGLLDLVESEAGDHLCQLIERMILITREKLELPEIAELEEADAQWLVKSNFWLLTARLLQDKHVPGFKTLDLEDLDNVFARVAKHYGATMGHALNQRRRRALSLAAAELDRQSSLQLVSTETLAKVYENVLITKETRKALGTHSTPSWLVDYMIQRLAPWIDEQSSSRRRVYEAACGHGPFLVGMLRHYCSMKPCISMADAERHEWLKARLCGSEVDDFAREVARLSLTLADIPNSNGWHLDEGNMFSTGQLEQRIKSADIIFSNPPFETRESAAGELFHVGQSAELLRRISQNTKPGTLLAYIMPQTILDSKKAAGLRKELLTGFEWQEILRLPDKVFEKADVETAIVFGRKLPLPKRSPSIRCLHVWDGEVERFRSSGKATIEQERTAEQMLEEEEASMLTPDLVELWDYCSAMERLAEVANTGQGFIFRSEEDPKYPKGLPKTMASPTKGYEPGFFDMKDAALSHLIPPLTLMLRDTRAIRRPVAGYEMGLQQVVMNHARVSRGPWRNVAYLDTKGHPTRGRFLVVRPSAKSKASPLFLWALLNSPIANAFTKSHSGKRDILSGIVEQLPVPTLDASQISVVEAAATAYRNAAVELFSIKSNKASKVKARSASAQMPSLPGMEDPGGPTVEQLEELKYLHWRMDAAVLALYQLPPALERRLLDYFGGFERVGVPFHQTEYYPAGFEGANTLAELLAITADWETNNQRRIELIEHEEDRRLTKAEEAELEHLQHLATLRRRLVAPYPMAELDAEIERLKREGKWTE
jgi:hypothetical protein